MIRCQAGKHHIYTHTISISIYFNAFHGLVKSWRRAHERWAAGWFSPKGMEAATCSTSGSGGSVANAHGDVAGDALGDAAADVASDDGTHGANGTDGTRGTDALGRSEMGTMQTWSECNPCSDAMIEIL